MEMVNERGLDVHHTTVFRWVQEYSPEIDKRLRSHLRPTHDSWRVDETYIARQRKAEIFVPCGGFTGKHLRLSPDSKARRSGGKTASRKMLKAFHTQTPQVTTVDKNPAYPKAIKELIATEELPALVKLRQIKYLNNIVEQDHRGIKRLVKPGMGFGSFKTARQTIRGYEIMNMMRKGQVLGHPLGAVKERVIFINRIFGMVA